MSTSKKAWTKDTSGIVTFIVVPKDGETHIYEAQKRKLASASHLFRAIFEKLPNTERSVITVTDFSPRAFKVMLRHVFGRPYSLDDWKLSLEVFGIAEKYQILSLQQECEEFFANTAVTPSNALEMFEVASKYEIHKVQLACEEVFAKDIDIILKPGFRCADKDLVKKIVGYKAHLPPKHLLALINWGMYECRRRKLPVTCANVENCVLGVCGSSLSCRVSAAMAKLNTVKAKKKSGYIYTPVEKDCSRQCGAVWIGLRDSASGTLLSSFDVDVICELKISVLKGTLEFTGIKVHLKPPGFPGENPLAIFYFTENAAEGTGVSDVRFNDFRGESEQIMFSQSLIVKSGQYANITVGIEDLQSSRCLENLSGREEIIDKANDVHFTLTFGSNQAPSSTGPGPFFVEKLYYKKVLGVNRRSRWTRLV